MGSGESEMSQRSKKPIKISAAQTPKVRLEEALCFNLYIASRLMTQAYRPYLSSLDLTYPQFLVMNLLWREEGLLVSSISDSLYLDTGTVTPLLKRLTQLGLITKERSVSDERQVHIHLTKKGRELELKAAHIPMEMFCKLKVSKDRFVQVRDGVREISKNLMADLTV
jgi:DNA-binding MarR family transcriptional regulator